MRRELTMTDSGSGNRRTAMLLIGVMAMLVAISVVTIIVTHS
jgi:hypothetical protein